MKTTTYRIEGRWVKLSTRWSHVPEEDGITLERALKQHEDRKRFDGLSSRIIEVVHTEKIIRCRTAKNGKRKP